MLEGRPQLTSDDVRVSNLINLSIIKHFEIVPVIYLGKFAFHSTLYIKLA